MKKKGVYPYDNIESFDKFNEKQLPKKENFHSILNNEHISDKTTLMLKMCEKPLTLNQWVNTMIYMSSQISFYYLMFSKISERLVCNLINKIHAIISLHLV